MEIQRVCSSEESLSDHQCQHRRHQNQMDFKMFECLEFILEPTHFRSGQKRSYEINYLIKLAHWSSTCVVMYILEFIENEFCKTTTKKEMYESRTWERDSRSRQKQYV